jgi:hypothetical protein
MTPQEFQMANLKTLESITGITRFMWCRYFNGKAKITESTLNKAALSLGWEPDLVLRQINDRRKKN